MQEGRFDVRLGFSFLSADTEHVATCPDLGPECASVPPPVPYNHHVELTTTEVSLDAGYAFTPGFAVDIRFPVRIVDIKPTYTELDGSPKLVPDDIHHHDVTIVGVADPWLMGRIGAAVSDFRAVGRFGVSIPLGGTEPDPYALGRQGLYHEHTQLGTGTFMPILGIGLAYDGEDIEIDLSALAIFGLYENGEGFRPPTRAFPSLRVTVPFLDDTLRPFATADLPVQGGERWQGAPGEEGDDGRAEILVGGGIAWRFITPFEVSASFRGRVAQLTDTATFDYPGILDVSLSAWIGGEPKKPSPPGRDPEDADGELQ